MNLQKRSRSMLPASPINHVGYLWQRGCVSFCLLLQQELEESDPFSLSVHCLLFRCLVSLSSSYNTKTPFEHVSLPTKFHKISAKRFKFASMHQDAYLRPGHEIQLPHKLYSGASHILHRMSEGSFGKLAELQRKAHIGSL